MTGALWYRLRSELRRRAAATIVLAVLSGLIGGVVLAVLRTLGFLRSQLAGTVLTFAATIMVAGVAFGVPLGVGLSRWSWRVVADALGTPARPALPVTVVALALPLTLLAAFAVAGLPARWAAGTRPAAELRRE